MYTHALRPPRPPPTVRTDACRSANATRVPNAAPRYAPRGTGPTREAPPSPGPTLPLEHHSTAGLGGLGEETLPSLLVRTGAPKPREFK